MSQRDSTAQHDSTAPGHSTAKGEAAGKKGPTPKRSAQEAANYRPLVPSDRKEARRQMREQVRQQQAVAREGAARGDDRYLRENERGPQKRFVRNVVDARFSIGELLLPLMFVVIFVTMIPIPELGVYAMGFIWIYLIVAAVEAFLLARSIKRRLADEVGAGNLDRGIVLATLGRTMQLRPLRMPKPQVKRGDAVTFGGR